MAEKQRKTLEQLTKEINSSELGLSQEDIASLFVPEDKAPPVAGPGTNPPESGNQTGKAPVDQAPPSQDPGGGRQEQPSNINELLPEKFRDADPKQSISKIANSYAELEKELHKKSEDLSRLSKYVQELINKSPKTQPMPQQGQTPDDNSNWDWEKPRDEVRKLITEIVPQIVLAGIQQYDTYATKRQIIDEFKKQHPDVDNYRSEIAEVLREHPELDSDSNALPRIYELAKEKSQSKYKKVAEQMGIVDEDKLLAKAVELAKSKILEEVRQRKAASGALPGSTPVTPTERMATNQPQKPLTPEEELFRQMLESGPKTLNLG